MEAKRKLRIKTQPATLVIGSYVVLNVCALKFFWSLIRWNGERRWQGESSC